MKNFTNPKFQFTLCLFLALLSFEFGFSQYSNTHYIPPSPWRYYNDANELVVTTTSTIAVPVTIRKSDGTLITSAVTTIANVPLRYRFASTGVSANLLNTVYSDQGLIVSSTVPIGVQVRNIASDNVSCAGGNAGCISGTNSNDCTQKGNTTFTSLGDQSLGTSFRLGYYRNFNTANGFCTIAGEANSPIYIVHARDNNTVVTYNGGSTITLQAGQSYLFEATFGSLVTATKPITMLSSKRIDQTFGCGDGVINPVIPTNLLGDKYVVYRSNGLSNYEKSTIVATAAGTTVTVRSYTVAGTLNATTNYTLTNAGDSVTIDNGIDGGNSTNVGTVSYITSTAPVTVYSGTADGCEIDMITQSPLSGCAGSFDVQTNKFLRNNNSDLPYYGYVIVQSGTAVVTFNGQNLESVAGVGARRQIGTTGFYLIDFTDANLSFPTNLRFSAPSRIAVAMVQSGGGYSMSSFITGFSSDYPPAVVTSIACPTGTTMTADNTLGATYYQWYFNNVAIANATSNVYTTNVSGQYSVAGFFPSCGFSEKSSPITVVAQVCVEICNNGIDDDGDGTIDGADSDCGGTPSCVNSTNIIFTENFGSGVPTFSPSAYGSSPGYTQLFATSNNTTFEPNTNFFAISSTTNPNAFGNPGAFGLPPGKTLWHPGTDHTGNLNGYSFVVNASDSPGQFFKKTITNFCPGTKYNFSIWVANLLTPEAEVMFGGGAGNSVKPNLTMLIQNSAPGNAILAGINTGPIVVTNSITWINYKFTFTFPVGVASIDLVLKNNTLGGYGNDLAIDDITFGTCTPSVTATSNAPTPICIGSAVTFSGTISSGFTTPTYQWQKSTNAGTTWTNIAGATSINYTIAPVAITDTAIYRLLAAESGNIANPNCQAVSNTVSFTVSNCGGNNRNEVLCGATLTINGPSNYTNYQWFQGTSPSGTAIAGATSQNVTVSAIGTYYVVCTIPTLGISYTETVNVVLFSGAASANPVIPFANQVATCPDDGNQFPKIFLCGATDTRVITTGITNASSITWEKLNQSSCPAVANANCPNLNAACGWVSVGTGPNYTASSAGEYRVRIVYPNGCFVTYYFNVFQNLLNPTVTTRDIACLTTGQITVNGVPSSGYEFSITSATAGYQPSNVFSNVAAGTYVVYVRSLTQGVGACVFTLPGNIIATRTFTVTVTAVQPKCFNDKGSIRAVVNGVNPQYTYVLTQGAVPVATFGPSNINDYTFPNLNAGTYNLNVTTTDGCVFATTVTLINPPLLTATVTLTKPLTCASGEITINPQGGTTPYTYTISGFTGTSTNPVVAITTAGTYNIIVTDANNCTANTSITVNAIAPPVYTITQTNVLCYGSSTGQIVFNVTNFNGYTVTYSINNGVNYSTNPVFSNLPAGAYQAILQYSIGTTNCFTAPQTVNITQPAAALTASGGVSELAGCGAGGTGKVRITNPQGGVGPYTYSFDNGATYGSVNELYLAPGTYTVYIKDANGCTYPMTVTVDPAPNPPTVTVQNPTFACTGTATSTVTVNNNGGNFAYTYFIDNVPNTPPTNNVFTDVACGPHTIKVTYQNLNIPTFSNLLTEDFGVGANTTSPGIASAYCFNNQPYPASSPCGNAVAGFPASTCGSYTIEDNQYGVTSAIIPNNCNWFPYRDKTSNGTNPNGRFLAVNIGSAAGPYGILYSKPIANIIPNQPVKVDLYVANLLNAGVGGADPDFILELVNGSGTVIATANTGIIDNVTNGWQLKSITLNPGANTNLTFNIRSGSILYGGNDAAIDDVQVYQLPTACITETTFPINIACNQAFTAQITGSTNVTCNGLANGTVTIAAQNYMLPYGFDYSLDNGTTWINSNTSPVTVTGLNPATYQILVRYNNVSGTCSFPFTQTITTPNALVAAASVTSQANCGVGAVITSSASGGTPNYFYQLATSGGTIVYNYQSSPTFSNVLPGNYIITVRDNNLCTDPINNPITVVAPTNPTATISPLSDLCYDTVNAATIIVTASGGVGPYKYQINGGPFQSSNTFPNLLPGNYTITVRDSYGCLSTALSQVIANQLLASATLTKALDCTASPNATITVTINGGTVPYRYQVSFNGGALSAFTNVVGSSFVFSTATAGNYQFTITDNRGCTVQTSTINVAPLPILNAPVLAITQGINCNGDATGAISIANSGGQPPYTNVVLNTTTNQNYGSQTSGLTAGNYTVTVTDANSCTRNTSITITQPNAIAFSVTTTNIDCGVSGTQPGSILISGVSGGTAGYTYFISNNFGYNANFTTPTAVNHLFPNLNFGIYTVTVVDSKGCQLVQNNVVIASPPTSLSINTSSPTANCATGGTIIVTVTPIVVGGPYHFAIFQNLPGVPGYPTYPGPAYQNNDPGFPLQSTFTGLIPGVVYTFIVHDAATNCYYFQTASGPVPTPSVISSSVNPQNVTCTGNNDGSVFSFTVSNYSGTSVSYQLYSSVNNTPVGPSATSSGLSGAPFTVNNFGALSPGNYFILFTENNGPNTGCTQASSTFTIAESAILLAAAATVTKNDNCNVNAGQVTATGSFGTPPYQYQIVPSASPAPTAATWAGGSANVFNVEGGSYTVYIKDLYNCIKAAPVVVVPTDSTPAITISLVGSTLCNAEGSFSIQVTRTSGFGIAPFTYSVDGGSFVSQPDSFVVSGLNSGLHTVVIRDFNGCTSSQSLTISSPVAAATVVSIANTPNCGISDGIITVPTSGGSGSYSYSISPVAGTLSGNVFSNLPQGSYTITVTDVVTLCTRNVSGVVPTPTPVTYALSNISITPVSCNGGNDGGLTIILPPSNNDGPYTYTISGPINQTNTTGVFTGLIAGSYNTSVSSASNCSASVNGVSVGQPAAISIGSVATTQFACTAGSNSNNNATIQVSGVAGGSGTYTNYQFSLAGTVVQFGTNTTYTTANTSGGNYTIRVFDQNGCFGSSSTTINPFVGISNPTVTVASAINCTTNESITIGITTSGGSPASLTYNVTSLTGAPYNVTQVSPNTTFAGLGIGSYQVTVTNPTTGCSVQTIHYVNQPNTFGINVPVTSNVTCFGGNNGSITITIFDNTIPPDNSGPFSYNILNNANVSVASGSSPNAGPRVVGGLAAGIYTAQVTLTNNPFCTVTKNFSITQPSTAVTLSSATTTSVTCTNNQGSIAVNANGGTPPYTFAIAPSGGAQANPGTFTGLSAGNYTITVTDSNGCTASNAAPIVLSVPPPISSGISAAPTLLLCFADNTATITATGTTGGQGSNYLYTLVNVGTGATSGPQLNNAFPGNVAGTYHIDIKDSLNCTFTTANITVNQPAAPLSAALTQQSAATCLNQAVLRITASGGTPPYFYSASSVGPFSPFPAGGLISVAAGTYSYFVRDANNCALAQTGTIIVAPVIPPTVTVDTTNAVISCFGGSTSVTAVATNGLAGFPYSYSLLNSSNLVVQGPQASGTFNNVIAGTYTIRVTNGDCVQSSASFTLIQPSQLNVVSQSQTNVLCNGDSNGTISVVVNGGTGIIQYSISSNPGQTVNSGTFTGLPFGTYTVFVQDQNGCTNLNTAPPSSSLTFTITQPTPISVISTVTQPACFDDKGKIVLNVSGGTTTATVGYTALVGTLTQTNLTGNFTFANLAPGIYPIKVTDANGCKFEFSETIVAGVNMQQNYIVTPTCIGNVHDNIVKIVVNPSIPASEFSYSLDGGPFTSTNIYTGLAPGVHNVTVSHTSPIAPFLVCTKVVGPITIFPYSQPVLTVVDSGLNQFTMSTTGGVPGYTYTVNGGTATNAVYQFNETGIYTIVVTDAHGCQDVVSKPFVFYDIVVPNFFTPNGDGTNSTWSPLYTGNFPNIVTDVFDRYGRKIVTLLLNQSWDGKYNGFEVPSGDYWYVIKLNATSDNREFVGNITLYR